MAILERTDRRRFTAEEVERMVEAGILLEDEPVELLEGELVIMSPQSPPHAVTTERIARLLEKALGEGFHARRHSPLVAADDSLPEPDVAVCEGAFDRFVKQHPRGEEVLVAVEIAQTSQALDRQKAAIYARAGVRTYWLLDLLAGRLEVRSGPQADGLYELTQILGRDDEVQVPGTGARLRIASLFP